MDDLMLNDFENLADYYDELAEMERDVRESESEG